ncbi:hypothetical protein PR202_gb04218 [Eleusine coracana subsp. coracana]|uniref:Bowman-Birk serine protease inhibitors family domain-containing protein n=1 Tax=Eleusine coracana subsp. coracana TaxID=191504 RepID=A0AAV5E2E1_ELECO|nr:hypothetical protein PR202_gb04218 [Eleusine coracana subsp. coracana]
MKPQALIITLAVVAVLAALPHAESNGKSFFISSSFFMPTPSKSHLILFADAGQPKPTPWPCCDNCGACNKKDPPECFCSDVSPHGCHPACMNCEKTTGNDGKPVYQCKDSITNFCLRRCTPVAGASPGI